MTNAGWYPDPAGVPDTYRYWDGQSWSQMTTSAPPARPTVAPPASPPPPPPPTPPPPGPPPAYAPQQWSPMPSPAPGDGSSGRGKVVGLSLAALLVLALVGVGALFGIRALNGDDDSATAEASGSADPTGSGDDPEPGDGGTSAMRPTAIQCTGGSPAPLTAPSASAREITGGGLAMPLLADYAVSPGSASVHVFADGVQVQATEVIAKKWISEYALGGIPIANGFTSTEHAADVIMQCVAADPNFYEGFSDRSDLTSEEITVDGHPGYRISAELRVSDPEVTMGGDDVTVIVVDTGSTDTYGLFLGVVPIGDGVRGDQLEAAIESIDVG